MIIEFLSYIWANIWLVLGAYFIGGIVGLPRGQNHEWR